MKFVKAIVYHRYGAPDVVACEEVAKPAPGDGEILIRVCAASVNPLDWHLLRGKPYPIRIMTGLSRPKETRLGVDVAGVVEAAGANVTELGPGDEVFGACDGAFAEYVCTSQSTVVKKPKNATFDQAACVNVAGVTALQALRDRGKIRAGHEVLINGAAGGVGTFAVQIAKAFGANVTGVCSTRNAEMVRSIGADRVVDYTHEDFTAMERRYDLILDCVGNRELSAMMRALRPDGICVVVGGPVQVLKAVLRAPVARRKLVVAMTKRSQDDLTFLRVLMESGKLAPVIDRRYALSEVPEALRYLGEGHARGKVVISLDCGS
jgi:NADPH:quinone reductase-like Zn-dependent oxidoreductase